MKEMTKINASIGIAIHQTTIFQTNLLPDNNINSEDASIPKQLAQTTSAQITHVFHQLDFATMSPQQEDVKTQIRALMTAVIH